MKFFRNFLQILAEKGLNLVLFSRDGEVTTNIHIYLALGELEI